MRVGSLSPQVLAEESAEQWFTEPWAGQQQDGNITKLKLYAHACRQQLGEMQSCPAPPSSSPCLRSPAWAPNRLVVPLFQPPSWPPSPWTAVSSYLPFLRLLPLLPLPPPSPPPWASPAPPSWRRTALALPRAPTGPRHQQGQHPGSRLQQKRRRATPRRPKMGRMYLREQRWRVRTGEGHPPSM